MVYNSQKEQKGHIYIQLMLALLANVASISYGFESGWISPTSNLLTSDTSPTGSRISDSTIAWIASAMNMSAIFGVLAFAFIADKFGRKVAIISIAFPQAVSWIIKISYPTAFTLVVARIFGGFSAGGVFVIVPMYVKEISQDDIRGMLGTLLSVLQNVGVFGMYALGSYLDYETAIYCVVGVPVLLAILMLKAPESPAFLIKKGLINEATATVAFLRGLPRDDAKVRNEIECMKKTDEYFKSLPQISTVAIFKDRAWRNGIILISLAFTFQALNGSLVIVTYALTVLLSTGVKFDISPQTLVLGFPLVMIASALSLAAVIDRFGRKWLLAGSFLISTISMTTIAICILVQQSQGGVPGWLPFVAKILAVAMYSGGVSPLPYIILSEMFSFQVRAKVMGGVVAYTWLSYFASISTYPILVLNFGTYTPFFIYAAVNILGTLFVAVFLPETKGKTDDQIREDLGGGTQNNRNNSK